MTDRYFPFKTLMAKIHWIKTNPIEIQSMFSEQGNCAVSTMLKETLDNIFAKRARKTVVSKLKKEWNLIEKTFPELNDTDVRSDFFWHIDAACEWVGMKEISKKDLY